ncbi:MAG: DUF4340 domain-containing protein [Kiritimatiellaeota bacterium]|nr:DUF4340 domain-containing protein [Kiritimatiellota bacterium]
MMSLRSTVALWLAVALAAVLAVAVFRLIPATERVAPRRVLGLNADEVTRIAIESDGEALTCAWRGAQWWLVSPVEARADEERILRLLDALALTAIKDRLPPSEQRAEGGLSAYGLDAPTMTVTVQGADGREQAFRFGNVTPHVSDIFLMAGDSPDVLVVERALVEAVPRSVLDLRSRSLLPYGLERLRRLEILAPNRLALAVEWDASGVWWIHQPDKRLGSAEAMEALMQFLAAAKIETFVLSGKPLAGATLASDRTQIGARYGCTAGEALTVQLWFLNRDGQQEASELVFGKKVPDAPESVYLLATAEQLVVTVNQLVPAALTLTAEDLRERRLFPCAPEDVASLRLSGEAQTVQLESPAPGQWRIVEPIHAPANAAVCEALVAQLTGARDTTILEPSGDERPFAEITLTRRSVATPIRMLISRYVGVSGETAPSLEWLRSDMRHVQRTEATVLPEEFGTPAMFAALRDVAMCAIPAETLLAVIRTLDGEAPTTLDPIPEPLTAALADLRAERVVALVPLQLDVYGLKTPAATLRVETRDPDAPVRILQFGAATADGGRYVQLKGTDSVFLLSKETAATLLAP